MARTNVENDIVLIKAIRSKDKKEVSVAFTALFNKYYKPILFHLRKSLNSNYDAEDLTAEIFSKAFENISKYNEESGAFSTWLFTLTKNSFIDKLRKKHEEKISLDEVVDADSEYGRQFPTNNISALKEIEDKERNNQLLKTMDKVFEKKPHLKQTLMLKYFENMSYDEISKELGIPVGTIKAYLYRAKNMMKIELEKIHFTL